MDCTVLILLTWNNREMFFPWVDRWLCAFYLKLHSGAQRTDSGCVKWTMGHTGIGVYMGLYAYNEFMEFIARMCISFWLHNIVYAETEELGCLICTACSINTYRNSHWKICICKYRYKYCINITRYKILLIIQHIRIPFWDNYIG